LTVLIDGAWISDQTLQIAAKKIFSSKLAVVPPGFYTGGYKREHSKASIMWLEYLMYQARKEGKSLHISHALNTPFGEVKIAKSPNPGSTNSQSFYYVDGYYEETAADGSLIKHVLEYDGCVFHGCVHLQGKKDVNGAPLCNPLTGETVEEAALATKKKKDFLESRGYRVTTMRECVFQAMLKNAPDLKTFAKEFTCVERLNPRHALYGGRTNATQLFCKAEEGERIRYADVTSLYPAICKYGLYVVGHPTVKVRGFKKDPNTGDFDLENLVGLIQCKMLPPPNLHHPVLPYRTGTPSKLTFPLCGKCAVEEYQGFCECSQEQRCLIGTWVSLEVEAAIKRGYRILEIYETWGFKETTRYDPVTKSGGLFTEYVNMFLKVKQEASGYPEDAVTLDQKEEYIRDYYLHEGILLNPGSIGKNKPLRSFAKLFLNSLWGKFAMKTEAFTTTKFIDSATELFQLLSDPSKKICHLHIINEDLASVQYRNDEDFMRPDKRTNLYIAAMVTAQARLRLLEIIEKTGEACCYYDTDSVIWLEKVGSETLKLGRFLGDLTDEVTCDTSGCPVKGGCGSQHYIKEFCSTGPKSYAYVTDCGKYTCKVKGFTLHSTNDKLLNFEALKHIVTQDQSHVIQTDNPMGRITRDKWNVELKSAADRKLFKLTYSKRVVLDNFKTMPYGTVRS
jgi:hypothetical protein